MIRADDYANLNDAAAALAWSGGELVIGNREYVTWAPLQLGTHADMSIRGEGSASAIVPVFDNDSVIKAGADGTEVRNLQLRDFSIRARSRSNALVGATLTNAVRPLIENVDFGPVEDGAYNLAIGLHLAGFDDCYLENLKLNAWSRGLLVHGHADQSYGGDLYLGGGSKVSNFRTPADWVPGSSGIMIFGAVGGFNSTDTDVIYCGVGLWVVAGFGITNRELFLGPGYYSDSCAEDGVRLDDNSCSTFQATGAWSSSNGLRDGQGCGVRVSAQQQPIFVGKWTGGTLFNNAGDGAAINGGRWTFRGSSVTENRGYGIHVPNANGRVTGRPDIYRGNRLGDEYAVAAGLIT